MAHPAGAGPRAATWHRLVVRNRIVAMLRVAVPAAGMAAFLVLAGQIWITNLARQYGVSNIRIDRGNLVVDTPTYSSVSDDGSRYVVNAREARTPLGDSGTIMMVDASLDFIQPTRTAFHALAAEATMDTGEQRITIPNVTTISSDDGLSGTLTDVRSDLGAEITTAEGPVDLAFSDGTTLNAANMRYDGKTAVWTFEKATLVVPELPAAEYDAATAKIYAPDDAPAGAAIALPPPDIAPLTVPPR